MKKKTILITGGSRGIGKSIALSIDKTFRNILITYKKNKKKADKVVKILESKGFTSKSYKLNMERISSINLLYKNIFKQFGQVDVLINNAGISQIKDFKSIKSVDFDLMINTNLRGPFFLINKFIGGMIKNKWGRIVNISSIGGQTGGMYQIHYACSKSALIGLTKSIARTYSSKGITCNCVAPGAIRTDMSKKELSKKSKKHKIKNIPVGRVGSTEEVVPGVLFLISEKASYITGQTININGGEYFS